MKFVKLDGANIYRSNTIVHNSNPQLVQVNEVLLYVHFKMGAHSWVKYLSE